VIAVEKTLNPRYRDKLFDTINQSPFVAHMGMEITDIGKGHARFDMRAAEFRLQPFGVTHGGNLATLIDSSTFWACYLELESDEDGLTSVDLKLNYLAASRGGGLSSTAKLIKSGRTLLYAEAAVLDEKGRLLAHGTSTLMRLPKQGVKLGIPMWL
jgi:uncharacterized protein (TIGR00369 family)